MAFVATRATRYLLNASFSRIGVTGIYSFSSKTTSILGEHIADEFEFELEAEYSVDRGSAQIDKDNFVGVTGHSSILDKADFAHARIGDVLEIPYEVTASDFWREMWQSVFYQQDRIHTSLEYANKLRSASDNVYGKGIPLPFSQMLYAATSMSHVDDTRNVLDLSFRNCVYERCVFPNDTLRRHFVIENIRESSNKKNILIDLKCKMYNQYNELVFRTEKTMFFEKLLIKNFNFADDSDDDNIVSLSQSSKKGITPVIDTRGNENSIFKKYILRQGYKEDMSSNDSIFSIKKIYSNELILHTLQRPIGVETNMNLSMLFRMTHPLLYNTNRYHHHQQLYVSGPLLIALTHSIASKELYEVIYEELLDSHIINKASPNDCVSCMTYIVDINDSKYEYFQEVECITIGLKNIDITNQLNNVKIPSSLFRPGIYPRDVENICNKFIPQLKNKIVTHSYRKLLRHKPKDDTMIPLL